MPANATLLLVPPVVPVDSAACALLGGFALMVQALMGGVVLSSLVYKRSRETPRRPWTIWTGDVGKQLVGQAFVHAVNVGLSNLIARHKENNPCSLYALNILLDTTLGVLILFTFILLLTRLSTSLSPTPDHYKTGEYGHPFDLRIWSKQAAIYVAALGGMKLVVVGIFWAIPGVFDFADWALSWLENDEAQVLLVMLIIPVMMNVFQFYVIDTFIKSTASSSSPMLSTRADDDESRRGFLSEGDSDSEDGPSVDHTVERKSSFPRALLNDASEAIEIGGDGSIANGSEGGRTPIPIVRRSARSVEEDDDKTPTALSGVPFPSILAPHSYPPSSTTSPSFPSTVPRPIPPEPVRKVSYGATVDDAPLRMRTGGESDGFSDWDEESRPDRVEGEGTES